MAQNLPFTKMVHQSGKYCLPQVTGNPSKLVGHRCVSCFRCDHCDLQFIIVGVPLFIVSPFSQQHVWYALQLHFQVRKRRDGFCFLTKPKYSWKSQETLTSITVAKTALDLEVSLEARIFIRLNHKPSHIWNYN